MPRKNLYSDDALSWHEMHKYFKSDSLGKDIVVLSVARGLSKRCEISGQENRNIITGKSNQSIGKRVFLMEVPLI
jgi:hypothetical protein